MNDLGLLYKVKICPENPAILSQDTAKYRGFCKRYKPKPKPPERYHWGSKILPKVMKRKDKNKSSPGQMKLPWDDWEVAEEEVIKIASKFVIANCYDPILQCSFSNNSFQWYPVSGIEIAKKPVSS